MKLWSTRRRGCLVLGLAASALGWVLVVHPLLHIAAGYCATVGAMQHFATGDSLETIRRERIPPPLGFVDLHIDEEARAVEARAGYVKSRAVYRDGLGATREETRLAALPDSLADLVEPPSPELPWPAGSSAVLAPLAADVDRGRLTSALDRAFEVGRGTHAVVVVDRGQLVEERYAAPYDRHTPLLGWSMTKSVTVTLVGRLVHQGRLSLDAPVPVDEWADDPRGAITLDDLLRMRSGLEFHQDHATPFCDSLKMLFVSADCAGYARSQGLADPVGERWAYSDGTSNLVAGLVLDAVSTKLLERLEAPQRLLFAPLGMDTAFIGVDGSGTFVGSSLMYACARDWARLGLLYVDDGLWRGERLLPEGWVDYVSRATENSHRREFGAHFWRIDEGPAAGVFSARGYQGQVLYVNRARRLVLLRMGIEPVDFDDRAFALEVFAAFPVDGGE